MRVFRNILVTVDKSIKLSEDELLILSNRISSEFKTVDVSMEYDDYYAYDSDIEFKLVINNSYTLIMSYIFTDLNLEKASQLDDSVKRIISLFVLNSLKASNKKDKYINKSWYIFSKLDQQWAIDEIKPLSSDLDDFDKYHLLKSYDLNFKHDGTLEEFKYKLIDTINHNN